MFNLVRVVLELLVVEKLTTGVKDKRKQFILETFVAHGANEDILYMNKPHDRDRLFDQRC